MTITLTRSEVQQVLDALEELNKLSIGENAICLPAEIDAAIETLRARLAQPELEPVAWRHTWNGAVDLNTLTPEYYGDHWKSEPLYTAPPQREWVGLTDEEILDLWSWSATAEAEQTANTQQHAFARAIEAKLKEKNSG